MEEFKITFWKEPFNNENTFIKDTDAYLTSAQITKTVLGDKEKFHIKLNDIGLDSLHGEFDIIRDNGFWSTSDSDSTELNLLKWNIIGALYYLNK